jgi:anthranilate phosphoribosyltransferase
VLLNAAAAMAATGGLGAVAAARSADEAATAVATGEALAKALSEGLARAGEAVDSGAAAALLARWVDASNRLATPRPR